MLSCCVAHRRVRRSIQAVGIRTSGGLQAGPPDKGTHHLRQSGPDMAERHRHHHCDYQVAAQRHLRLAADKLALHAVDPVNAGIDPLLGIATVVAALHLRRRDGNDLRQAGNAF